MHRRASRAPCLSVEGTLGCLPPLPPLLNSRAALAALRQTEGGFMSITATPLESQTENLGGGRRRRPVHVALAGLDRKSTRLNSSHVKISYAVFCLKKKIFKHYLV